jgi:peptide/nickel transport system permease protein
MNYANTLEGPSAAHIFGTDEFGRDLFSRLAWGARPTLVIATSSVTLAALVGALFGLVAGYYRLLGEFVIMRFVDLLLCFPPIFLAVTVVSLVGSGIPQLVLTIALLFAPRFARVTNNLVMAANSTGYAEAARAIGCSDLRIMLRGILPNITAYLIVQISYTLAFAILLESGLSFLGLGVMPPEPSWGRMIGESRMYLRSNSYMVIWPSVAITGLVLSVNILGDVLRDWADPRTRHHIQKH